MKFCYIILLFSFLFFASPMVVFSQSISNDITLEVCGFVKISTPEKYAFHKEEKHENRMYTTRHLIITGVRVRGALTPQQIKIQKIYFSGTPAYLSYAEMINYGTER